MRSQAGLITTLACQLGPQAPVQYALEGAIGVGGSGVSWLRDNLGLITCAEESEALAASVPSTAGRSPGSVNVAVDGVPAQRVIQQAPVLMLGARLRVSGLLRALLCVAGRTAGACAGFPGGWLSVAATTACESAQQAHVLTLGAHTVSMKLSGLVAACECGCSM